MTHAIPHCSPPAWPADVAPGRFASLIRRDRPDGCVVGLIGLADDLGVRLNHGRPGAKDGPAAFRAALARYGAADRAWPGVFDAGDVAPAPGDDAAALDRTHARVTEAAAALLDAGLLPVGIGGGHDLTFPLVRAVAERERVEAGVYFDAHLDVRDTPGSGMAFRSLVERCGIRRLEVHGVNAMVNSREHVAWFGAHGGRIVAPGDDRGAVGPTGIEAPRFASLDLDVLDASHAPGVSAPNPAGWTPDRAAEWCGRLGRDPSVRCFDIMELNPEHDEGGRTARVAAHLFLSFLRGVAERVA